MSSLANRWHSLPKRTRWLISEGAKVLGAGATAFGLQRLYEVIFSRANEKDEHEMEKNGLDPEAPNFNNNLSRFINAKRDEVIARLERVLWRLNAAARYKNEYDAEDVLNFSHLIFELVRYAPSAESAALMMSAVRTWQSLTDCGLRVQERPDNPLLIRYIINVSENESDPEEVMTNLMTVMQLAESGAPLE